VSTATGRKKKKVEVVVVVVVVVLNKYRRSGEPEE